MKRPSSLSAPCAQELKGNIRVFCRVRPAPDATEGGPLAIGFPAGGDLAGRGIELTAAPAAGRPAEAQSFAFDRVFGPTATQAIADDTHAFACLLLLASSSVGIYVVETVHGKEVQQLAPCSSSQRCLNAIRARLRAALRAEPGLTDRRRGLSSRCTDAGGGV